MKARLLGLLVLGSCAVGLGIDYDHTTNGAPTPARHPGSPAAAGCVDCEAPVGVSKSVSVSPPTTTLKQTVYKVDCVREEYRDQTYTAYEPKQYTRTENYEYKVNVPTTEYGTVVKNGYRTKTEEYTADVNVIEYYRDRCGCLRSRCVVQKQNFTRNINIPYTYEQAVQYPSNRIEDRVAQREVNEVRMEPVKRTKQIAVMVPYANYEQETEHTATYTITSKFRTGLPTEEGEKLWLQQQRQPKPGAQN